MSYFNLSIDNYFRIYIFTSRKMKIMVSNKNYRKSICLTSAVARSCRLSTVESSEARKLDNVLSVDKGWRDYANPRESCVLSDYSLHSIIQILDLRPSSIISIIPSFRKTSRQIYSTAVTLVKAPTWKSTSLSTLHSNSQNKTFPHPLRRSNFPKGQFCKLLRTRVFGNTETGNWYLKRLRR